MLQQSDEQINSAVQVPPMLRGMLPIFDVVCSRKASGPWETPGIVGTADGAASIGPGWGIPTGAGCTVGAALVAADEEAIGDLPTGGAPPIAAAPPTTVAPPMAGEPPTAGGPPTADAPPTAGLLFIIFCQC